LLGWHAPEEVACENLHPEAVESRVLNVQEEVTAGTNLVCLMLWKRSGEKWANKELFPIREVKADGIDAASMEIIWRNGQRKTIDFGRR